MSSSSEKEIDLHMSHMSTSWSGHLDSCQSNSDLRTSNLLYANQIKIITNKGKNSEITMK